MATFTPPLIKDRPPFLPDSSELQKSLWRHFENRVRGANVWILTDGTVVQDTASPENSNTSMTEVYPWDTNKPKAPYVRSIYVDPLPAPQIATEHDVAHDNPPVAYFYGGMSWPVTPAQVAILTNPANCGSGTGYADCIS